jgi:hypothetical protein
MSQPASDSSRAGAAKLAPGLLMALALGAIVATLTDREGRPVPPGLADRAEHTSWDGGTPPAGTVCVLGDYVLSPQVQGVIGLRGRAATCRICAEPDPDGGVGMAGATLVPSEPPAVEAPWQPGWPQIACGLAGTSLPRCACAPADGGTCEARGEDGGWGPAPLRVHFLPHEWSGGCVQKACGEFGGRSSWPADLCGPESAP